MDCDAALADGRRAFERNAKFGLNGNDKWLDKEPFNPIETEFSFENEYFSSSCILHKSDFSKPFDDRFLTKSMKCNYQHWGNTVEGTGFCAVLFLLNLTGEDHKLSDKSSREMLISKLQDVIKSNKKSGASWDEKQVMLPKLKHMIKVLQKHTNNNESPQLTQEHWVGTSLITNFSLLHDTDLKLMLWEAKNDACIFVGYNQCLPYRQRLSVERFRSIILGDDVFHVIHNSNHFFLPPNRDLFHKQLRVNFTLACEDIENQIICSK